MEMFNLLSQVSPEISLIQQYTIGVTHRIGKRIEGTSAQDKLYSLPSVCTETGYGVAQKAQGFHGRRDLKLQRTSRPVTEKHKCAFGQQWKRLGWRVKLPFFMAFVDGRKIELGD